MESPGSVFPVASYSLSHEDLAGGTGVETTISVINRMSWIYGVSEGETPRHCLSMINYH